MASSLQLKQESEKYMYECVYHYTCYSKSVGQPGKVANSARGQLNRENCYFLVRVRA